MAKARTIDKDNSTTTEPVTVVETVPPPVSPLPPFGNPFFDEAVDLIKRFLRADNALLTQTAQKRAESFLEAVRS